MNSLNGLFERTLIISPHYDDETIGCGGLIQRLKDVNCDVKVVFVTESVESNNYKTGITINNLDRMMESVEALKVLGLNVDEDMIVLEDYPDGEMDTISIKKLIGDLDEIINTFKPTAVLFPYSSHHQDHQVVHKASIAAVRPKVETNFIQLRAMYEYPYMTGWSDSSVPTSKLYVMLSEYELNKKYKALKKYESQLERDPRDPLHIQAVMDLAKTRGREVGERYAEAYYLLNMKL